MTSRSSSTGVAFVAAAHTTTPGWLSSMKEEVRARTVWGVVHISESRTPFVGQATNHNADPRTWRDQWCSIDGFEDNPLNLRWMEGVVACKGWDADSRNVVHASHPHQEYVHVNFARIVLRIRTYERQIRRLNEHRVQRAPRRGGSPKQRRMVHTRGRSGLILAADSGIPCNCQKWGKAYRLRQASYASGCPADSRNFAHCFCLRSFVRKFTVVKLVFSRWCKSHWNQSIISMVFNLLTL